ncbi:hypothetical protein B0T20DRAFT_419386 [Sordaria brevicollis]|uniref:Uncharacterized protein n=1 Tax=Sordaria brevicollis TaxID=83679 RepID=A0AAE0P981_SORBR|nr:hypothetical protein B0T20DRAFT_419386 [Sordaria brevicollis]
MFRMMKLCMKLRKSRLRSGLLSHFHVGVLDLSKFFFYLCSHWQCYLYIIYHDTTTVTILEAESWLVEHGSNTPFHSPNLVFQGVSHVASPLEGRQIPRIHPKLISWGFPGHRRFILTYLCKFQNQLPLRFRMRGGSAPDERYCPRPLEISAHMKVAQLNFTPQTL